MVEPHYTTQIPDGDVSEEQVPNPDSSSEHINGRGKWRERPLLDTSATEIATTKRVAGATSLPEEGASFKDPNTDSFHPEEAQDKMPATSDSSLADGDSGVSSKNGGGNPPNDKPRRLGLYLVLIFLAVCAAVVVPVFFFTKATPSATTGESASESIVGLPNATLDSTKSPEDPLESFVEYVSPTQAPTTVGPTSQLPTFPGNTPYPTLSPTPEPTKRPTPSPTVRPTPVPTSSPTFPGNTHYPTLTPTSEPTKRPTPGPTAMPTSGPTHRATPGPTAMPTTVVPTPEPTASPTDSPTSLLETQMFSYLTFLGTRPDVLADESTPQGKALRWLIDPNNEKVDIPRAPQQYALVALDFALHDNDSISSTAVSRARSNSWSQPNADICLWQGVTCNNENLVTEIKWSNQSLTGTMIPEISLLDKLEKLDIADNDISGTMDLFWKLPSLKHLYIFANKFTGSIPSTTQAPGNLTALYAHGNQLTGTLPISFMSNREGGPRNLKYLILHNNQLSGTLPEGIRLRQLFYLDLSNNNFEGPLPFDFAANMVFLRILYLGHNQFSGTLPTDFSLQLGDGRLKQLFIPDNQFTGEFPSEGWDSYHMTNMDISGNSFDGFSDKKKICKYDVMEGGELVEFRTNCELCVCETFCHTCT